MIGIIFFVILIYLSVYMTIIVLSTSNSKKWAFGTFFHFWHEYKKRNGWQRQFVNMNCYVDSKRSAQIDFFDIIFEDVIMILDPISYFIYVIFIMIIMRKIYPVKKDAKRIKKHWRNL